MGHLQRQTTYWGIKLRLNKSKRIEIIQIVHSDHIGIKLEINDRKYWKTQNIWELNNMPLSNTQVKEKASGEILKYF